MRLELLLPEGGPCMAFFASFFSLGMWVTHSSLLCPCWQLGALGNRACSATSQSARRQAAVTTPHEWSNISAGR